MEDKILKLKVLYRPDSELINVKIFGVNYMSNNSGPNVFVVKTLKESKRLDKISFHDIDSEGDKVIHSLEGCTYKDIKGKVHIQCKNFLSEFIEEDVYEED